MAMLPFQKTDANTYWINDELEIMFDAGGELDETLVAILIERQQQSTERTIGPRAEIWLDRALQSLRRDRMIRAQNNP